MQSFKTEIKPTFKQKQLLKQHIGAARWAYNFGLERKISEYKASGSSPNAIALHKEVVLLKQTDDYKWLKLISKCSPQMSLRDLDIAFKDFYRRCKLGAAQKGHPKFKSKHSSKQSFRLDGVIRVLDDRIQLPKIGRIKLKEKKYLPTDARITSATVSLQSGRWFVSINIDKPEPSMSFKQKDAIGIDLGLNSFVAMTEQLLVELSRVKHSDNMFNHPRAFKRFEKKLAHLQRDFARTKKKSKNRAKALNRVARLYFRITNVRKDFLHKLSTAITKQFKYICLENLNIKGMMKNHNLAKSIGDASWAEFTRQLEYKSKWYGSTVLKIDRFFPSTKQCSNCKNKKDIGLNEREYVCKTCNLNLDRDLNASYNILIEGMKQTNVSTKKVQAILARAASSAALACGEDSSVKSKALPLMKATVSLNQEL